MKKIRNNVYVYIGLMIAFCAVILFGILCGPQHPNLFFLGIIILALAILYLYFSPSWKDSLDLAVRVCLLCLVASVADMDTFFGFFCVAVLFFAAWLKLEDICFKQGPRWRI